MTMKESIQEIHFDSRVPGPLLVVLGRVHGNEPCGQLSIERVAQELRDGKIALKKGLLRMIPCCNPQAATESKRYIEKNLNRVFENRDTPLAYEERLANTLIKTIGRPDALLDLHSFGAGESITPPFALYKKAHQTIAALTHRLELGYVLSGWHELQEASGRHVSDSLTQAERVGAMALGVECGRHDDPKALELGYTAIRGALDELGMLPYAKKASQGPKNLIFQRLYVYSEGGEFSRPWTNFSPIKKGEPLAKTPTGETLHSPIDGMVVLPNPRAKAGDEWFYLAS